MGYSIDYSSRELEELKRQVEDGYCLADIQVSLKIAETLHQALTALDGELRDCIQQLLTQIESLQRQIEQAEQSAIAARAAAMDAQQQLNATPSTKLVMPSKEDAAKGAKPKQVPANQEKIANLKGDIARRNAESQHHALEAASLKEKVAPLQRDLEILKKGQDRIDDYLGIAEDACLRLETALREADVRCRDDILPKLDRIQQLMEKYDEVTIHPLSSYQADGIRQKEMG